MPTLLEFDTRSVRPPSEPRLDTQATLSFSRTFDACPRLAHGFSELDVDKGASIRAKLKTSYVNDRQAHCHIMTWHDSILYSAIDQIFVLGPSDLEFLTGERMRNLSFNSDTPASVRVKFDRPFITPPKVVVFLNHINLDQKHNWRLKTTATDIDVNGFTLNIETWGDTIMYNAQACWIAYPDEHEHIFSTSVNTTDVHPSSQPQLKNSKPITFGKHFAKTPNVFIALNYIDIDCSANLRIKAYVDGVSENGLVWHLDSRDDTNLYTAGASIIAFD